MLNYVAPPVGGGIPGYDLSFFNLTTVAINGLVSIVNHKIVK